MMDGHVKMFMPIVLVHQAYKINVGVCQCLYNVMCTV